MRIDIDCDITIKTNSKMRIDIDCDITIKINSKIRIDTDCAITIWIKCDYLQKTDCDILQLVMDQLGYCSDFDSRIPIKTKVWNCRNRIFCKH